MKRIEAIDSAFKAGFELANNSIHVGGVDVTDEIALLVNIVEQVTLEGAAEKLAAQHTWITNIAASQLVLKLKDSHD